MEGRFSANLGGAVKFLKRAGFFFYCSKALYPIMFTIFFRASNHQILDWQKELKNWICFFKPAFLSAIKFCSNIGLSSPIVAFKNPAPRVVIKESKENLSNQWLIEYLQIDSLFYSFSPEWRQHYEKHTILPFLYHLSNTITTDLDDYKWAKIVIYLSRIYRLTPWCLWPKS